MPIIEHIQQYHERTKHHPDRYARSLGYMDWRNQPNPFRFYANADRYFLPLLQQESALGFGVLFDAPRVASRPLGLQSLAAFLELSLGLSAWKQAGASEWSLRMNPSSGNLHPTEAYLLLPEMAEWPACIVHYSPLLHCLEIRGELDPKTARVLSGLQGFGLVLSSIYWREAWKYGERAFRYTQHDIGHALGALRFSATLNGWGLSVRSELANATLDRLLGFSVDRQVPGEREQADCFCWISTSEVAIRSDDILDCLAGSTIPDYGDSPNRLSPEVVEWPIIEEAAGLCASPGYAREESTASPSLLPNSAGGNAERIIRQRRSAQAYLPERSQMDLTTFRQILSATLPTGAAPFDLLATPSNIHLFLFVHRVDGLEPGLYCLLRREAELGELRSCCKATFLWQRAFPELPLFLLQPGDYRALAESISCHQAIAGESSFSLGMLTRFSALLDEAAWRYPSLFWEAGLVGQVLYLAAEAQGFRGTGIGCYFDDLMHDLLGLQGQAWQDLYHFTVGTPLDDSRLQTKPPYHHLAKLRESFGE